MPRDIGFRTTRLQDISREIAFLRTRAEVKRKASVDAHFLNPELSELLMSEAVQIEEDIDKLVLLQLNYKQNPLPAPVVITVPFREKVMQWLKKKLKG